MMPRLTSRTAWSALALACAGLVSAADGARAGEVDVASPVPVVIGLPRSPSPVERGDLGRSGRSSVRLPLEPTEIERRSVGAFAQIPVATEDGGLVIALASPEVLRLDPTGKELYRTRIGTAQATRPPVLLPNGGVAVLTAAPSVVFVSPQGKVDATVPLPKASFGVQSPAMGLGEGFSSIAPTFDGAVAVAALRAFMIIEPSGSVRAKVELPEPIVADLVLSNEGWLTVGSTGTVWKIRPPAAPKRVGGFPGMPMSPMVLANPRTIAAQVAGSRIFSLDPKTGTAVVRASEQGFASFDSAFVVDAQGVFAVTTNEGFLVRYDAGGAELSRTPVDRNAGVSMVLPAVGRIPQPSSAAPRGTLLVDDAGNIAFTRPTGRFGVRAADGHVHVVSERVCQTAMAIVPQAAGRVAVVCREGTLLFFGEPP